MNTEAETVLTQDVSSGRIHVRFRIKGRLVVDERCNTDDAGSFRIIKELPEDMDASILCKFCFPAMHDPRPANTQED